jgi:hypothetical protein
VTLLGAGEIAQGEEMVNVLTAAATMTIIHINQTQHYQKGAR